MPAGRPTKYRKDFHPDDFMRLSNLGKTITQISREWNIGRDQMYKWAEKHQEFHDAVKRGRELCEGWYTDLGQAAMVGKIKDVNLGFYVWLTKNILKWSDRTPEEVVVDTKSISLSVDQMKDLLSIAKKEKGE